MVEKVTDRDQIAYKPNSFIAYFEPRGSTTGPVRPDAPLDFRSAVETDPYLATLHYGARDMLTVSDDNQVFLLLAGDIYRPQGRDAGRALLEQYERRGLDFTQEISGEFSLILIDRRTHNIAIVTDRLNSFKVLVKWDGDTLIASNSIYLQPIDGDRIDRAALACYLASGFIYNDRTLYEGVRMLEGASVYRLADSTLTQHKYWRFMFTSPTGAAASDSLKHDMGDLLVEAVKRRFRPDRPTYVSLSAGYDSSAILGILANYLRVPEVHCFSYAYGDNPRPDSDEKLARLQADLYGYPHEVLTSFDGDLMQLIRRNGHLGGGMAQPCDEVDTWLALAARVGNGPMPVLYTGATMLFRAELRIDTIKDAVVAAHMPDFSALAWLEGRIGTSLYGEMLRATHAEIHRAVSRHPPTMDGIGLRDMLRFDNIYGREIATWREYFAGRVFRVANPLLDNDLLDFILSLPVSMREGKRLYLDTVTGMFPDLYASRRATTASYTTYWAEAIKVQSAALREFLLDQSSPLDAIIEPELLLSLLMADLPALTRSNALLGAAFARVYRLVKRARMHRAPFVRPSLFIKAVPALTFLKRVLVVRSFLADMSARPSVGHSVTR